MRLLGDGCGLLKMLGTERKEFGSLAIAGVMSIPRDESRRCVYKCPMACACLLLPGHR